MDENSGSRQALQYVLTNGSNVLSEDTAKRGRKGQKKEKENPRKEKGKEKATQVEINQSDLRWRGAGVCVHVCREAGFGSGTPS